MCWRTKKVRSSVKKKSKDVESSAFQAEVASAVVDQNQLAGAKPDKHRCFREALIKSQDEQKTIAVGTLAEIIYEPTKEDKKSCEAPRAAVVPVNTPTTKASVKKDGGAQKTVLASNNSKIPVAVSKKSVEISIAEKPMEVTAAEETHTVSNDTNKTAGTQLESKSKSKDQSKGVKQIELVKLPLSDKVPHVAKQKISSARKENYNDKNTKSPATGTGLSVDTGGAQISIGGMEEPEVFENVQLASTMRAFEQKLGLNSATTNTQKSVQHSVAGKNIIIGFPDNLSDENENDGEKLYHANAAVTASGMFSHLIDDGAAATGGNEDRKALSRNRPDSRMTKKSSGRRQDRDEDTLRDVPRVLPEKDYDEFLPPIVEKKVKGVEEILPKRRKKRAKTEEEILKTEEKEPCQTKPDNQKKPNKEARDGKSFAVEDKTPPSESPERT